MTQPALLRNLKRLAIVVVVLAALQAAVGFLLVPWLAQRYIPQRLEAALGRDVSVAEFRANPFLLTLHADKVRVEGHHGRPMVAIDHLLADFSLPGLLRGVWSLDRLALHGAQAHLVLREDGTLNVADALAPTPAGTAASDSGPPAIRIGDLTMPDARLVFTDLRGKQPAHATIAPLSVRAGNLSTLPGDSPGSYQLTAALPAEGTLALHGQLDVQPSAVAGSGTVRVQNLRAGELQPFLPAHLDVAALQGQFDLVGEYVHPAGKSVRLGAISATGSGVSVTLQGEQQPVFSAERIRASGAALDLGEQTAQVDELAMTGGRINVVLQPEPAATPAAALDATAVRPGAAPWNVDVAALLLEQVDLGYVDRSAPEPVTFRAEDLSGTSRLAVQAGGPSLQLVMSGAQAQWQGATLLMPGTQVPFAEVGVTALEQGRFDLRERDVAARRLRVEGGQVRIVDAPEAPERAGGDANGAAWDVVLERLELQGVGGRYEVPGEPAPLQIGSVDGTTRLALQLGGARTQVLATDLEATVRKALLPGKQEGSVVRLDPGKVSGGRFDLAARRVGASSLTLAGEARLVREEGGELALPALLAPQPDRQSAGAPGPAWRYLFERVQVPSLELAWVDRSTEPTVRVAGRLQGSVTGLGGERPASFESRLALQAGGSVAAAGTIAPEAAQVRATFEAKGLALEPLQPLLARFAALELQAGTASGAGTLTYGPQPAGLRLEGSLGIANLRIDEAGSDDRFLSWKQLEASSATLDLGTRRFTADEISVQEPGAKIVISEDRQLNLLQVLKPEVTGAGGDGDAPGEAFSFEVGRLQLRDGQVDFADRSLVLPFSARIDSVDGSIVGITSDDSRRAAVRAEGEIEPYGSARVEGSLLLTQPREFTALDTEFVNVPVPPLSPYTATFAGRRVESGKLWLDLQYRVKDGELLGSNDIRLQDFTLGERVEAPDALDIPLELVVGLLKDAKGEIRLSVPVTGDLENPRFSVASAVRQALGNVLRRIAGAPFRALASVFGRDADADALAEVDFAPGSARLRPQEREKLDALTRALRERPQLDLVVVAPYDPQRDALALKRAHARRALAQALGRDAAAAQEPAPIAFDDPQTRQALRRLLGSAAGAQAVRELEQQFGPQSAQLYQAMFDRIADAQPLRGGNPQLLGIERAREIAGYLREQGIDASRVRTGTIRSVPAGEDGDVTSQLQVALAGGGQR